MFHFQLARQDHPAPPTLRRPTIILDDWQYRVSADPHAGGRPLGNHWLSLGPGLQNVTVTDGSGADCGVLLGTPIDLAHAELIRRHW